jgi:hypothetical protein
VFEPLFSIGNSIVFAPFALLCLIMALLTLEWSLLLVIKVYKHHTELISLAHFSKQTLVHLIGIKFE